MFDSLLRTTTSCKRALQAATFHHINRVPWDASAYDSDRDEQLTMSRGSAGSTAHDHWVVHAGGRLWGRVIDVFTPELVAECDRLYRDRPRRTTAWYNFIEWCVSDHLPVLAHMSL